MIARPARLALLILCLGFLMRDFHDTVAIAPPPAPKIERPVPPPVQEVVVKTVVPPAEDIQLEIDAYRLANSIEMWWTIPDTWSGNKNPFAETESSDYGRWVNPPPTWNPSVPLPGRILMWQRTRQQEYERSYRAQMVGLIGRFQEKGIVHSTDYDLESAFGPKNVRATIDYLRSSANEMDIKERMK